MAEQRVEVAYRSPAASALRRAGPRLFWRRLSPGARISTGVLVVLLAALVAPGALAPYDPTQISPGAIFQPPGGAHWLGTDQYGRDLLSRLIYGTRLSMTLGIVSVTIAVGIGLPVGAVVGFFRGRVDALVMRVVDVVMSFPGILLALLVIAILGPGLVNAMIAVGIGQAPVFVRVVRAATFVVREQAYIEATRALGAGSLRALARHVVPNIIQPVIVVATLGFASAIIVGSSLGFLGLGAQPPAAEWGTMVSEGRNYLRTDWWIAAFPGLTIGVAVLSFNILGDALRDLLDPRLRQR
jgi:ABC-type dipeptide/oligopeptide/nickel transport system permease subunit